MSALSKERTVAYFVGAMRALAVGGFATAAVGLDRDRALIPRC